MTIGVWRGGCGTARPLRINLAGAWYHVVSRGNGGERIFRDDTDRRRFLGLVSELPERFSVEIHAFVLMDNHYHLLLRCRQANLSHTIRWLQTAYAGRFNWAHRRRGHVFQGRFKSNLLLDEKALDEVGRYLHLNPVRVRGLGLSKEDQRRARMLGVQDPGQELVRRRLTLLRDYPWSSWRGYSGLEAPPTWLCRERLQGGGGGRSLKEQQRALRQFTEAPIRQGHLENPWAELIGGVILGSAEEAQRVWKQARADRRQQTAARRLPRDTRPSWAELVAAVERVLGRPWSQITQRHGDWGRDGLLAVATRHWGWRLAEVVKLVPGMSYAAAAQGIRRFRQRAEREKPLADFAHQLAHELSKR